MKRILAFSKYLAYNMGGAEASTRELLAKAAIQGAEITVLSQRSATFLGKTMKRANISADYQFIEIDNIVNHPRFAYLEYARNAQRLKQYFSSLEFDELWTYGTLAPAAAMGFNGVIRYYIRSESDIGIAGNYQIGPKRILKHAHNIAQWPATQIYRKDLGIALAKSTVIANSQYMAEQVRQRFGISSDVSYPDIDIAPIRQGLIDNARLPSDVVFVGDGTWKGLEIVLALANLLPDTTFSIHSRLVAHPRTDRNITWHGWTNEPWRIYQRARLVIVPSQCVEGYGRVSREARLLGLPVLVSDTGGLPESVDHDPSCIVKDYRSVQSWKRAISKQLATYPA